MLLSVIVISYNTSDHTLNALRSVFKEVKLSKLLSGKTELILVDNNSKDKSLVRVSQYFKKLNSKILKTKKIFNKKNVGFAQANNQGIEISTGKYILLLNSDTILQPQALNTLVETFENNPLQENTAHLSSIKKKTDRLGILAATLLNPDGTYQTQGGSLPTLITLINQVMFLDDLPFIGRFFSSTQNTGKNSQSTFTQLLSSSKSKIINIGWVSGAAMMIRRKLIDEIGMLDGNIFMYAEDLEFCLRARNHHWDIAIQPQAFITHLGSASSSSENAILGEIKGYLYLWSKHKPHWQMSVLKFVLFSGIILRIILFSTFSPHPKRVKAYKKALSIL